MNRRLLAAVVALLPAAAWAGKAGPPEVDLLAGYWRTCVSFTPAPYAPDLLAKQAAADPEGFGKRLAQSKVDLGRPAPGWPFYWSNLGERAYAARTPAPPTEWFGPDFDDRGWPRQRLPFLTGKPRWEQHCAGLACFRARLLVADPAAVRKLTLHIAYRGGAVVYFNGQELGRGHLPAPRKAEGTAGKLSSDAPAESYPAEAYWLPELKLGGYDSGGPRPVPELWGSFPGPTERIYADAVTFGAPIDDLTSIGKHGRGYVITRGEWETIAALRDRKLGPLEVPPTLIRKGANVLAVEIHRGWLRPGSEVVRSETGAEWRHCYLVAARAECQPGGAVLLESSPAGPVAWNEDIHQRCYDLDLPPADATPGPVRMVAARNGVCSGQVVVWSGDAPAAVKASAGDLAGAGGARIPSSAVEVRYGVGHLAAMLGELSANAQGGRGLEFEARQLLLSRYAPGAQPTENPWSRDPRGRREKLLGEINFYDHLAAAPAHKVPAGRSLPVWITVRVPGDARPGRYEGRLLLSAGSASFAFPLWLQVMDWKLPEPAGFTTVMALEPSPYGVANHYKVPLWGDAHFRLMEESFKRLAEIGNDLVVVPVLLDSEFGNGPDSMIRWQRSGGKTEIDFAIAERFLDLVGKHLQPRCVCVVVCHSPQSILSKQKADQPQVAAVGAEGKLSRLDVPALGTPQARDFWRPLVEGLRQRLAARGLEKALHWGYIGDTITGSVDKTIKDFAQIAPGVGWARGAHEWSRSELPFSFATTVRMSLSPLLRGGKGVVSNSGWKQPGTRLVFTRVENGVAGVYGFSAPLRYRLAPEAAIYSGCHGIGRWGADYWAKTYATWFNVTPTVLAILWPGPGGAEGGARFECLREGLQEAEARVYLEKKLEAASYAATPAGQACLEMLNDRIRAGMVQVLQAEDNTPQLRIEECFWGWQERSWDLYAAAAAAAAKPPSAEDRKRFFGE